LSLQPACLCEREAGGAERAAQENVDVSRLLHQHWRIPELLPELLQLLELY
jgi:hypothetical protein